jgi:hypothetical protein
LDKKQEIKEKGERKMKNKKINLKNAAGGSTSKEFQKKAFDFYDTLNQHGINFDVISMSGKGNRSTATLFNSSNGQFLTLKNKNKNK